MKPTSTGPATQAGSNASADRANSRSLDAQFCRVFEEITARLLTSPATDVDALLQEHPEHADRLRELLPAIRAMAEMGHASGSRAPESRGGLAGDALAGHSLDQTSATDRTLGDFRLLREIGRGGMGIVYEAEQISLARRVALKVLPFASVLDERQRARFKNEAMAAALLKHPNIVTVYSVGCERGVHYYAMELVEGQSLAEVITELRKRDERPKREGVNKTPLPSKGGARGGSEAADAKPPGATAGLPGSASAYSKNPPDTLRAGVLLTIQSTSSPAYFRTVAELGIQAADALEYAHSSGVIHRDIKPANLIVDSQGKLSITDFGLARIGDATANLTMTGDLLGTLRYMSPEQALGKPTEVDHRTDVYSLGITLYELLTLQPAFAYDDRQQLLKRIADDEPKRPSQLNARIPQDLETIILKAIAKDSRERYASAQDLATDLRRFLEHKPIAARRPTLLQRTNKLIHRHRTASVMLDVAAIFFVMFTTAVVADRRRHVREASRFVAMSIQAARTALVANDVTQAVQRSSEAQTRIDADRLTNQALMEETATLLQEAERYAKFVPLLEKARTHRSRERTGIAPAEEALALYRVMDKPNWLDALRPADLPQAHIKRITEGVYELLLLKADDFTRWSDNWSLPNRDNQYIEAVEYLEKARSFHAPSRGYYWLLGSDRKITSVFGL